MVSDCVQVQHRAARFGRLTITEAILLDDDLGLVDDVAHVNTNDLLGSSLGGEHAKNTGTTADVEDRLALEQVRVVHDGVAVRQGADLILEHLLVDTKVSVGIRIAVMGRDGSGAIQSYMHINGHTDSIG